jgi:NTE family protein
VLKHPYLCANFDEVVYLFQGGGALGAFQVGVYQALEENGFAPDWIAGISIGAINSAIIAGNEPNKRTEKLNQFWDLITHNIEPQLQFLDTENHNLIQAYNMCSAMHALSFGQKGFFNLKGIAPWLIHDTTPDKISFYDTAALRDTLMQVIDFDYLNKSQIRLSLGAVNIRTGRLHFFDNTRDNIEVDHIMASCALPPGFPAIKIEDEYYWDGGLYSNTPLICVINDLPHKNRLCFLVDLFDSTGLLPHNMDEVLERAKDINYAGQIDMILDFYDAHLLLEHKIAAESGAIPDKLSKLGDGHNVHISKIVYKAHPHELHSKDYEFSNFSARKRIAEGYAHTKNLLADPDWWKSRDENIGTIVHPSTGDMSIVIGSCACRKDGHYT